MKETEWSISFTTVWKDIANSRWPFNEWCHMRFSKPIVNLLISVIVLFHTLLSCSSVIEKQSRSSLQ
jgi:hypothetical protein